MNYYRGIWARRSHKLAPLTKITSNKVKFKWTKIKQDSFDEINQMVERDTLLTYTGFNENFKIHNNTNNFELGSVIGHKVKLIAFYGRKLTDYQTMYTVIERELLIIVKTLK